MAMDAGVGIRNFASERRLPRLNDFNPFATPDPSYYEAPSTSFNKALDRYTTAPDTPLGKASELVSSAVVGARLPAPQARNPVTIPQAPATAGRAAVLESAGREGYVAPPSSTNPSFMNRLLEGISGKVKLGQEAGIRNQAVTDRLAREALGESAPLNQAALGAIRSEASRVGYAPVKAAGRITADARFAEDLIALSKVSDAANKAFPGIKPASQADDILKALRQEQFDADSAISAIQHLRSLADDAYSGGNRLDGQKYKGAAKAIEDVVERHLDSQGEAGKATLAAFREARKLIAKTYTAGRALVGESGESSAAKYAQQAGKKPLEGKQKQIADFASTFSKYTPTPKGENFPAISPLDVYGSAIAAGAAGNPLPLFYPLTRAGIRNYLLSPSGQARAMPQAFAPQQTLGLLGAYPVGANALLRE